MLALFSTIDWILSIYMFLLFARVVFSWLYAFNIVNPRNEFVRNIGNFLYAITEPVLRPIRRIVPVLGTIDISTMVALLIVYFLRLFLIATVYPALISL